jgi:excisionase family DNA binding protein
MEKLFTVREVAEYFKVSKQTVHNWIWSNKLTTTATPGGELRVTESEIKKVLEAKYGNEKN